MSKGGHPRIAFSEAGPSQPSSTTTSPALDVSPVIPSASSPRLAPTGSRLAKYLLPGRSRSSSTASVETATGIAEEDEQSGRSTPEQRRRTGRAAASLLADDSRYKKFCTQVDRALQSFESVNEWADFISFLSRLLKTLQVPHPPFHEIPRKLVVAKRLAQCLNPALPSGVHQRALEVYAHIFSTIGVDGLRRDLQVWSSGLFPFFQFATTSARPHLLNIYETYYLPLGSDLRSAAKAFLLALLPGLEEETGDFFERVLNLLSNLSEDISPDFFLHNIFLILISSSSSRLAALNYLARRLPKPPENLQSGLVLRGIAAALEDENVLVRRNGLDLLFRIVRMDGELYRSAEVKDKDLLLRATAGVVLQRDISLSRRVYIWLLGSGDTSEQQIYYFKQNGHDQLAALLQLDMAAGDLRSYRIFLALMDKWEVGALLGEQLALSAIRAAMSTSEDPAQEISITIRAVYEAIDPGVTWKQLFRLLEGQQKEDIDFVLSLMSTVKQHEDEVKKVYVPATLDYCLVVAVAPSPIRSSFLRLAEALLPLIPVTEWILASSSADLPECGAVFDLPIDEAVRVARACLIPRIAVKVQEIGRIVKEQDEILVTHRMLSTLLESEAIPFQSSEWLNSLLTHLVHSSFEVVESTASIVLQAVRYPLLRAVPMDNIVEQTMTSLLRFLRLDHSAHHARAVELIFELKLRAGVYVLENSICEGLQGLNRLNAMEEFGTLWRLTENSMLPGEIFFTPMLMMLDALGSRDPVLQRAADTWLRTNMGSNFRFLDPLLCRLLHPSQDLAISTHLMDTLAAFVQYGGESLGKACQNCETDQSPYTQVSSSKQPYMDLIVDVLSQHLHYTFAGPTRSSLLLRLHSSTLEVMKRLLAYGVGPKILDRLQLCLLDKAEEAVRVAELNLQSKLLSLMNATLPNVPKRHRKSTSISEKPTDRDGRIISLIQTGIVDTRCHPVLRYWIDFILESAGHFQHRRDLLESLSTSLTAQTRLAGKMPGSGHDLELDMFLEGLERVIMLLLPKAQDGKGEDGKEGSSILGYMSGVFTVEGPVHVPADVQWLDDAVHALLSVWTTSTGTPLRSAQRVLSKTFKTAATAAFGSLVRIWALQSAEISDMAIFDAVDHLTTSAQKVVEMIGEGVVGKKGESVDPIHLGFLEAYLRRLEAPIAVQIWSTTFTLARDLSATATTPIARAQLYPLLRCLTALARTVATTSALEDKRMRRDLLETWSKLLDHVVVNLPRLGEVDFWQRGGKTSNEEVNAFFASEVIPSLRNLLVDNDRVAVACSSIATGSLIPAFRQHKVNPSILNIVFEMSHLSGVRSWRPLVGDAFNDARFFRIKSADAVQWQPIISSLMNTDKERFLDLLGRIQAGPSANIFVNREQEMISRSLNLRRLSFVLLSAENNHYLTQLPSIQEKLVDILRNDVVSPQVHSEVYLCLRVLLCRISAQHITNFWPVILSELVKVFEGAMDEPPPDGSEELLLVLAACKFLELLLLMQSEDFQIHQWMFVTDTTDAAFPLEGYEPESILDRLNEILSEHAHIAHTAKDLLDWEEQVGPRRPRLTGLKSLDSLYQLQPFFARASIDTFEGVYSGQGVDWEKVEEGLLEEIFEK